VPDARESALYLLGAVLSRKTLPQAAALLRANAPLSPAQAARLAALCARRAAREPLQYILGAWDFAGLEDVAVRAPVLVPRPETEDLVALAVAAAAALPGGGGTLLDVGTGSGVVAGAMLARLPGWRALALDVSAEACALAEENGTRAGVGGRLAVRQGDLRAFVPPPGCAPSLVVSNPPYVPECDLTGLQPEVAQWEDARALAGGAPRGLGVALALLARAGGGWGGGCPLRPGTPLLLELDAQHPALLHALLLQAAGGGGGAEALRALRLHPASGLGQPRALTPQELAAAAPLSREEAAAAEAAGASSGSSGWTLRELREWRWVRGYYSIGDLPRFVHLEKT
jgi:release factor glutamine methyltransferase